MRNKLLNLLGANRARGQISAEGNTIFLYDFIAGSKEEAKYWGGMAAEDFAALLGDMSGEVHLRIDSPGGDVFGGRAIAQAIREHDGKVIAHIDGLAASAASYIAIAADEVIAAPGAFMMVHKAWSLAMGNSDDFTATASLLDKIDGSIAASYAARGEGDAAFWLEKMAAETWLTGAEAQALGLVDKVIDEAAPKARAAWDLSAFDNAPAPDAAPAHVAADYAAAAALENEGAQAAKEIAARKRQLAAALLSTTA
jgi:ATP-dependent Clp protease protease subunit